MRAVYVNDLLCLILVQIYVGVYTTNNVIYSIMLTDIIMVIITNKNGTIVSFTPSTLKCLF